MIFGYARVSTQKDTQKHDRQIKALKEYAKQNSFELDEIIEERISGSVLANNRPEYTQLKAKLRQGDILIVTDLDRLGRDADDTIAEIKSLKAQGVKAVVLDIPFLSEWDKAQDDSIYNMVTDILITLKAHIAEQEREKTVTRIKQGLEATKAKGTRLGRPPAELPDNFKTEYDKWKSGGYGDMTATKFAKLMGLGRSTLYKYIHIYDSEQLDGTLKEEKQTDDKGKPYRQVKL